MVGKRYGTEKLDTSLALVIFDYHFQGLPTDWQLASMKEERDMNVVYKHKYM